MSFSCPELSLSEMLTLAENLGYAGIETRVQSAHGHGVEFETTAGQRQEILQTVARSKVHLCCIATSCAYADPATVDKNLEDTHQAIDLAGDLGCSRIRVFGGMIGEGLSREDAIRNVANALASAGNHAEDRGVTLCLETHDAWCDPGVVVAVMEVADHPNVAVNWDIMHPICVGETMENSFDMLRPWTRHVHVHDGRIAEDGGLTMVPIGDGMIDHATALRSLRESGYDGYLSGEWIGWEPYEVHLPRELALLEAMA